MRKLLLALVIASTQAMAGGSSGTGTPPTLQNLDTSSLMNVSLEQLPKAYADQEDIRRATGRLSVAGAETTDLIVDGKAIQVRKLRDSVVDENISKEILSL